MPEVKTQRLYTIPLQDAWKVPYKRRAQKAVALIQKFVVRHMKADPKNVRVGSALNDAVWARGIKHPPRKVKVQVVPHEVDVKGKKSVKVWVELEGVKLVLEKKKEEKKAEKKPAEKKTEAKPAAKAPEARKEDKTGAEKASDAPKTDSKAENKQ